MSRFRLAWARQRGERKAKECGFEAFPIDPFKIAMDEGILVEAKSPDQVGVSGGILFVDDGVGIFYATNIESRGFQRFTVAHELGHYFLDGHPEEILKAGPMHVSRAGFTQGGCSIELEADHFASGLLLPTRLVTRLLGDGPIGLEGIDTLCKEAECSLTASAIRAAECSPYPMAIVVSRGDRICYGFLSDGFKRLGDLSYPKKDSPLPEGATRQFNADPANVALGRRECGQTSLQDWFDGQSKVLLDEEIVGLGNYGFTLTIFSSEDLVEDPGEDEDGDEEEQLIESYALRFARGR